MDKLRRIMRIVDEHSHKIPEGDYLELCNVMRDLYQEKDDDDRASSSVFSGFTVEEIGIEAEASEYFQDVFEERINDMDILLKQNEMDRIKKLIYELRPVRRITTKIKRDVIRHFANINQIVLPENTIEYFELYMNHDFNLKQMCRNYIDIENEFRRMSIEDLNYRYRELQSQIDRIIEFM
jgi:hypothetical protein